MDAQKNRDRFKTQPRLNKRGKPTVATLTHRQPRILELLSQHRTLTTRDLHGILGGNLRALYKTLDTLKCTPNEYIRVIPEQARWRPLTQPISYELTQKGIEWLNRHGHHVESHGRVYNLGHTTLVSHIMASIAAGIEQRKGTRLVTWDEMQTHPKFPDATRKAKDNTAVSHPTKGTIRPDTHPFGIELLKDGKKAYRFFVVEADNGTETIKPSKPAEYTGNSIYAKFEAYLDFIESKSFHARYGLPNYFVLFVFTNRHRLDTAKSLLASMTRGGSKHILFQLSNEAAPAGYIFTTPCERVGHEALRLDQP